MQALPTGTCIRTEFGREVRVIEQIGKGGQGEVYRVSYAGQMKALKWYDPESFLDRDKFMANIRRNILSGSPTSDFLWPQDMTQLVDNTFGYIMDLRPDGYYEVGDILLNPGLMPSFKRSIDACLNIVTAFRVLHNSGYRYQDINDGNFFVEPHTGKVLICDNDNVAPEGVDTGMKGFPRFMAPEIVVGTSGPTVKSDLHSMAVLIFCLLVLQHPLEGVHASVHDEHNDMLLYGTQPVFIFDRDDKTNKPIPSPENNALRIWPCLPSHLQDLFCLAFSHDALHRPGHRPNEMRWVRELTQFRSEVALCHCGNEVFLQGVQARRCERCGALVGAQMRLESAGLSIPVLHDGRMYRCQGRKACSASNALDPLLWMLASKKDPSDIGLRNMSQEPWTIKVGGRTHTVSPGQVVRAVEGAALSIAGEEIHIVRNV